MLQMSESRVIFSPLNRTLPGLWRFHSENSVEAHEIHDRVTEKLPLTNFLVVSKVCRRQIVYTLLIVFEPYRVYSVYSCVMETRCQGLNTLCYNRYDLRADSTIDL